MPGICPNCGRPTNGHCPCENVRCSDCGQVRAPQCRCDDEAARTPLDDFPPLRPREQMLADVAVAAHHEIEALREQVKAEYQAGRAVRHGGQITAQHTVCLNCGTTVHSDEWDECPVCLLRSTRDRYKALWQRCAKDAEDDIARAKESLADVYCILIGDGIWDDVSQDERCARAANEAQQAFLYIDGLTKADPV